MAAAARGGAAARACCFVYGSLLAPEVLRSLLGRVPAHRPARLAGHERHALAGRPYPGVVPSARAGAAVRGLLLEGLSAEEEAIFDEFEGDEYVKRVVRVAPEAEASSSPLPQVEAPVYIYKDSPAALLGPWSYDQFREVHLAEYVTMCDEFTRGLVEAGAVAPDWYERRRQIETEEEEG